MYPSIRPAAAAATLSQPLYLGPALSQSHKPLWYGTYPQHGTQEQVAASTSQATGGGDWSSKYSSKQGQRAAAAGQVIGGGDWSSKYSTAGNLYSAVSNGSPLPSYASPYHPIEQRSYTGSTTSSHHGSPAPAIMHGSPAPAITDGPSMTVSSIRPRTPSDHITNANSAQSEQAEPELEWFQTYIDPSQKRDSEVVARSESPSHSSTGSSSRSISPIRRSEYPDPDPPWRKKDYQKSRQKKRGSYLNIPERIDSEGFISDGDSDYEEFQSHMARLEQQIDAVRNHDDVDDEESDHEGTKRMFPQDRPIRQRIGRTGPVYTGRGGFRGPRRAAQPTGDVKMRLHAANQLFLEERYLEAKDVVFEIISINAETHEAWTLLATIWKELGEIDWALRCLMFAAHMRPKHLSSWFQLADLALNDTGDERAEYVNHASFAYSAALKVDVNNLKARLGKAQCYFDLDRMGRAVVEFKRVLELSPHNLEVLEKIAEACIDINKVDIAKDLYRKTIAHFRESPAIVGPSFGWADVDTYLELFAFAGQYDQAIKELKSLVRWLLGRDEETFWDNVTEDDREWDASNSRRLAVEAFVPDRFPNSSYGAGLPLEFRIKLGLYRLRLHSPEAWRHLEFLDLQNKTGEDRVLNNPHLCLKVADTLLDFELYDSAMKYYDALKAIPEENTASLYIQIGKCLIRQNLREDAEKSFKEAIRIDDANVDARKHLAKLFEEGGEEGPAFDLINQIMELKQVETRNAVDVQEQKQKQKQQKQKRQKQKQPAPKSSTDSVLNHNRDGTGNIGGKEGREERLKALCHALKTELEAMRYGDIDSTKIWMDAAHEFTNDFRGARTFYNWEKFAEFKGYSEMGSTMGQTTLEPDLVDMTARLAKSLGAGLSNYGNSTKPPESLPLDFKGIRMSGWLDLFLEYAICLAKNGRKKDSYEIIEAAKDSHILYNSRESKILIHLCWCMCAVILNDDQTVVTMARFFMKKHQFTTDSYRIFSTLTRVNNVPVTWYTSGPTQKYILRQIKTMDYALVDDETRKQHLADFAAYSVMDENGNLIANNDMDISLVMLYGYILFTNASYRNALNYFFRAHALDPENPMVNLSIGLAYVHYSLKRQVENRQHAILQGLTFMFRYYDTRSVSDFVEERLEAHYNVARVYHMLGLVHLALPYYWKVLNEPKEGVKEDLVLDTAYNMQTIYMSSGNPEMAQSITHQFLVI
ncbi:Transcription factor tau subunit [Lachnellula suecica]|uniref:Transcription factor tau subunit n=1 Tax=Lachnellula suecica TaxID=602035 RepID=A0A8T9C336_9HELO|nr:Transcription factor tau subunit [Lachnellula suecica]